LKPARRRDLVKQLEVCYQVSQRKACDALGFARSSHRYKSTADRQDFLRIRLKDMASVRINYGYRRLHVLLEREGWHINHKRVYRLYTEEGLTMHRRRPRRRFTSCTTRKEKQLTQSTNECWSMDFMADQLADGHQFRILTIVDNFTRESLGLYAAHNIKGDDVVDVLCKITRQRGAPQRIQVDNGSEFTSRALDLWAYLNKVKLDFSRPGKPTDNAFIESFNGKFRAECLNENWFLSMSDACDKIQQWQDDYNRCRPHSSLEDLTPAEFAARCIPSASLTAQLQEYNEAI
jgi:putative transposase